MRRGLLILLVLLVWAHAGHAQEKRRASLIWLARTAIGNSQPIINSNFPTATGLMMPSTGRLQDLMVVCTGAGTGTFTIKKNGIPTDLSCSIAGNIGCRDLFSGFHHFVNYSTGDFISFDGSGGNTNQCRASIAVLSQAQGPHDATLGFGLTINQRTNDLFCQPTSSSINGSDCQSTATSSGFILPANATVTKMSDINPNCTGGGAFCGGIPPGGSISYTFLDNSGPLNIFTNTFIATAGHGFATCMSNCSLTAGHRYYSRFSATVLNPNVWSEGHLWEFDGIGQILTGRNPMWAAAEARYTNMHLTTLNVGTGLPDPLAATICNDRPGLAQNFLIDKSLPSVNSITATICVGDTPATLDCDSASLPSCTVAGGDQGCTDAVHTVLIPRGYAYAVKITSPGTNTGTIGFSFEMAPTTDTGEIGGCGFETPIAAATPTPTQTPSATLQPGMPTYTPTDTPTSTPTPTMTGTQAMQCVTWTPSITPTPASSITPTTTPTFLPNHTCCECGVFGCVEPTPGSNCPSGCTTTFDADCGIIGGTRTGCIPRSCGIGGAKTSDVKGLRPTSFWGFGELPPATTATDLMGVNPGTYTGNYILSGDGVDLSRQGLVTTAVPYEAPQTMSVLMCVRGATGTFAALAPGSSPANALLEVSPAGTLWWGTTYGSGQFEPAPFGSQYSEVPPSVPFWPAPRVPTVSDGIDHLIVGTLGQSGGQKTYLDGELIASAPYHWLVAPTPGTWTFGNGNTSGWPNVTQGGYIGRLQFAAWWKDVQLTDAQIRALVHTPSPTPTRTGSPTRTPTAPKTFTPTQTWTPLPSGCCQCNAMCVQPNANGFNCNLQGDTPCVWFEVSEPCPALGESPIDPLCQIPTGSCCKCTNGTCVGPPPGQSCPPTLDCNIIPNAEQPCSSTSNCTTHTPTPTPTGTFLSTSTPTITATPTPTSRACCQCVIPEGEINCYDTASGDDCPTVEGAQCAPVIAVHPCFQGAGVPCLLFTPTPTGTPIPACCQCQLNFNPPGPNNDHAIICQPTNSDGTSCPPGPFDGSCVVIPNAEQPCPYSTPPLEAHYNTPCLTNTPTVTRTPTRTRTPTPTPTP